MEIKKSNQYTIVEFQSLVLGDVFVFNGNVYMVCENSTDSIDFPANAVNLRTGGLTYFDNGKLVLCYSNAILNLGYNITII